MSTQNRHCNGVCVCASLRYRYASLLCDRLASDSSTVPSSHTESAFACGLNIRAGGRPRSEGAAATHRTMTSGALPQEGVGARQHCCINAHQ